MKTLETDIKLHATSVPSGLLIVSGAHAQIQKIGQKALGPSNVSIGAVDSVEMTDCFLHGSFHVTNGNYVRIDNCFTQSEGQSVSLKSTGMLALRQFHVRQASEISLDGPEMIVKESTWESEQALKANGAILDWENVRVAVKEKKIEIQGVDVLFNDVKLMSKGTQRIKGDAADLSQVIQVTGEGSLKLKTKELGYYKDSKFIAHEKSIKIHSEDGLSLKRIFSIAKQQIQHLAITLYDEASTHAATLKILQHAYALHSINNRLLGGGPIALLAYMVNAFSLTVNTSQTFDVTSVEKAVLYQAVLRGNIRISVVSLEQNVLLTEASMATSDLKVDANSQIQMRDSKVIEGEKSSIISHTGWIEAQGSKIEALQSPKSEEAQILFQAEQGTAHLDHHEVKAKAPVHVRAQSAQIDDISVDSEKEIAIKVDSVSGLSGKLKSAQENIIIDASNAIFLDKIQKTALQGIIRETSSDWIMERENDNKAQEIYRRSKDIQLTETDDQAKRIKNEAIERLSLSHYHVKESQEVALISEGKSAIVDSDFDSHYIDIYSDALWIEKDKFYATELHARAHALHMRTSETVGQISTFDARSGTLTLQNNLLNSKFNRLLGNEQILFQENTTAGSIASASAGPQIIRDNTFVEGDHHFKSAHDEVLLQTNHLEDVGAVKIEAPESSVSIRDIHANVNSFKAEAIQVSIQKGELYTETELQAMGTRVKIDGLEAASEKKITVEGVQLVEISHSQLRGKEAVKISGTEEMPLLEADLRKVELKGAELLLDVIEGKADQSQFLGHDVQMKSSDFHFEDSYTEGGHVSQQIGNFSSVNSSVVAAGKLDRLSHVITTQGGVDSGAEIREKAQKASHFKHVMRANAKIEEVVDEWTQHQSTYEAPQIDWNATHIQGTKANIHAQQMSIDTESSQLPLSKFEVNQLVVKGEGKVAFPLSEFHGEVIVEPGFNELDLTAATVKGSLHVKGSSQQIAQLPLPQLPRSHAILPERALFTFSDSFRSVARESSGAFCSSAIAKAITSSQTAPSDPFLLPEILSEKVNKAPESVPFTSPQTQVLIENLSEEETTLLTALKIGKKVVGGFKLDDCENLEALKEKIEPLAQPIQDFVHQVILAKRKFPTIFEGQDTTALRDILRKRNILTASDLLIDDGQGHIERERIQRKLKGVSPEEAELILSHFSNEPAPFGLRHEHGVHWSYLKRIDAGQYQAETTLGDGNCAFNGIALGFRDLVLSDKIDSAHPVFTHLREKLGLESADKESFKAWIAVHSSESHQRVLQGIFREIAVAYIELNYDDIYREGYEKQLYDAYGDLEDDTFRPYPHIADKFKERGLSPNSLSEWWQTEGKAIYFANMRHASWAWGGESEIDALARYLGVTLFWQKGGEVEVRWPRH